MAYMRKFNCCNPDCEEKCSIQFSYSDDLPEFIRDNDCLFWGIEDGCRGNWGEVMQPVKVLRGVAGSLYRVTRYEDIGNGKFISHEKEKITEETALNILMKQQGE